MSIWCEPRSTIGPPPLPLYQRQLRNWCMSLKPYCVSCAWDDVAIGRAEVRRHAAVPLAVYRDDAAEQPGLGEQLLLAVLVARVGAALVADWRSLPVSRAASTMRRAPSSVFDISFSQ